MANEEEDGILKRNLPDDSVIVGPRRKRVAVACNSCRSRKSKCDGWRPKCTTCQDYGFECVYKETASVPGENSTPVPSGSAKRLDVLENVVKQQPSLVDMKRLLDDFGQSIVKQIESVVSRSDRYDDSDQALDKDKSLISLHRTRLQDDPETTTEEMSDGMGTLNFADEEDSIYFGPSSTVAFIGHISSVIAHGGGSSQRNTNADNLSHKSSPLYHTKLILSQTRPKDSPKRNPQQVNKYVIPPRPVVMSLLDQFFRNTYIIFPIFHPKTFISEYEEAVKSGFTNVTRTWLARLNMVLAIATSASTDSDISVEKHAKAEEFYLRAAGLYDGGRILKSASLESVQILILMSQYLQGTQKPIQCWHSLGLAIRAALQLGLHSKQALKRFPPLERELRKRTWHACVLIDRTICMTFGRPSAIPVNVSRKIELPLDINDQILELATIETPEKSLSPTIQTFYIYSIHLYDILGTVIDEIYWDNLDWNDTGDESGYDLPSNSYELAARIAKIEKSLFLWRSSLPADLQVQSAEEIHLIADRTTTSDFNEIMNDMSFILKRQRIILTLRYHSVRILLHRQTISNSLLSLLAREKGAVRVSLNFEMDSIQTALQSSIETVNIVKQVGDHVSLLGAWWFTLYYVFKSALVMVGVLVIYNEYDLLSGVVSGDEIRNHLETAVFVIEEMSRKNDIAGRCLLFLRYLKHAVSMSKVESGEVVYRFPDPYSPEQHNRERNDLDLGMGMGEFMLESDLNMLEELFKHGNKVFNY